ncbi:helix-turn-helix transcriptional regulator [Pseudonocardia sp. ICBG1034]|uniref:helix-turn-helix domain-containing protein n=1 Tax=Pseudonocardia sp. ICBG1034 TaxID=2844381 RepID=UPI001CCC66CC|nr:hypothetical protein [Pseudonocardia sp. ICBG1034]
MTDRPRRPARRLVIDWALVEQRRVAAGMTHTELADRVGAGAVTGPARLWTDNDHDTVSLGLLERLCQVLDLHPTELFRAPTRNAQRRRQLAHDEPADVAVIAAALATVTCPPGRVPAAVNPARLAEALGWTLARLADALAALAAQLDDTGLRIEHDPAATSPAPIRGLRAQDRCLTDTQRVALHRLHDPEPGLDVEIARLLYAIAHDPRSITERHLAYDPAAVVALQQRGLIRRHPGGGYLELTDDAHYSLAADPAPPAP